MFVRPFARRLPPPRALRNPPPPRRRNRRSAHPLIPLASLTARGAPAPGAPAASGLLPLLGRPAACSARIPAARPLLPPSRPHMRTPGDGSGSSGGGGDDRLVAPYLAPTTSHKDAGGGRRTRPPSRNALSVVFMREDEGLRVEQTASSWAGKSDENKRMDQGLKPEAIIHNCGASLETTNEIQKVLENADSVHQGAMHSGCLPSIADNVHFMEVLNIEDYETPSRFRQSSSLPGAMSSSKATDEMQSLATSHATDMEGLTKENNTEASMPTEYCVLDPAKDYGKYGVPTEDFYQPDQSDENPKCAKK